MLILSLLLVPTWLAVFSAAQGVRGLDMLYITYICDFVYVIQLICSDRLLFGHSQMSILIRIFSPLIILVLVMTEEQLMNCNIFLFFVKKWLTWRQIFIHFAVIYRTFLSTGLLSASRRRPERWGGCAVCARSWRVCICVCAGVWDVLLLPATVHWLYGCGGRLHAIVCQVPLPPCRG